MFHGILVALDGSEHSERALEQAIDLARSCARQPGSSTRKGEGQRRLVRAPAWCHDRYPATSELWVYDFGTNQHFTLKTKQLTRPDLDNFVDRYKPGRRARTD